MARATITSKGQTTIPKSIRQHLRLKTGDRVEFVIEANGRVALLPLKVDIADLKGILAPAPRRLTIEEMDDAIREAAVERHLLK
jgi:antitoxin PrlF